MQIRKRREPTRYFGYGENSSMAMMKAIIGRYPKGYLAEADGWKLVILSWADIPEMFKSGFRERWNSYSPQIAKMMEHNFRTYAIRRAPYYVVQGYTWLVTEDDLSPIKESRLVQKKLHYDPRWYATEKIRVRACFDGSFRNATTEVINELGVVEAVDGKNYNPFLNRKDLTLQLCKAKIDK